MKRLFTFLSIVFVAVGCTEKKDTGRVRPESTTNSKFPEVKELSRFKETDFVLTPQSPLAVGKNAIYAPTMLYAWNEVKDLAAGDVFIDPKYADLVLLNYSKSFLNALQPGEYTTGVNVTDDFITIKAEFSKSLPFEKMFHDYHDLLQFKGQKVQSFGCTGSDYELLKQVELLHYSNGTDFIVRLNFKDAAHEMLFCMNDKRPATLEAIFSQIDAQIKKGAADKVKHPSKYKMATADDELILPKLAFNIENDYKKLINNKFLADNKPFRIRKAWQRTAFVLDESGAAAESEALIAVDSLGVEEEKPHPKKLHFNKPFLVMLKRKDSPNPYFAMWVENTELMQKK